MCNDVFFCDTTLDLRLWACAMMFFFCDTTLDLRLWACAMMFFSVIQNTCAEALGMCNDELGYG